MYICQRRVYGDLFAMITQDDDDYFLICGAAALPLVLYAVHRLGMRLF